MTRAAFSVADVRRAIHAVETANKEVETVEIALDGSIRLSTRTKTTPQESTPGRWTDHAGEKEVRRA